MKIRRFLSAFLLFFLLAAALPLPRALALEDPKIEARVALLMDGDTGFVLYGKNEHDMAYPASITKLMTALLVFEAIDRGDLQLDQKITATASAMENLDADGSTADIEVGEVLTVEQLLYCMLLVSANEACNIVAEAVDGSVDAFVAHMNQRAEEMGCTGTHFVNTSGIHDPQHYTTAWDIYLLTLEVMKHEHLMEICNAKAYTVPATNKSQERELHTTNGLISNWRYSDYLYDGAQGIKTGTTPEAGNCLVSSAVRGDRHLISVVLGAEDKVSGDDWWIMSFVETARLFDWGFDNFAPMTVLTEDRLYAVPVSLSKEMDTVMVHPAATTEVILPKGLDAEKDLTYTVDLPKNVDAPVAVDQALGQVTVSYNGNDYVTVPLLALDDVPASSFLTAKQTVRLFFARTDVRLGLIGLAAAVILFLVWWKLLRPNRRYGRGDRRYQHKSYRGRRR